MDGGAWEAAVHGVKKSRTWLSNFTSLTSMWDECNCAVVWAFFGITFLWDWNEHWPFQSCGHCWVFQMCWHIECSPFTASSFRIWNSSTRIPSPPPALFIVMLPKSHLTSHSRMSGSRWVITPSWLSGSWRSFLYLGQAGPKSQIHHLLPEWLWTSYDLCLSLLFSLVKWEKKTLPASWEWED